MPTSAESPAASLALAGPWQLRPEHEQAWRPAAVPGCWEALGLPKTFAGPCWYRIHFRVPAEWAGRRLRLRFGAVSYHCAVFLNGQALGEHTGLWDSFTIELGDAALPDAANELLVRAEKPASLAGGPDSARLPGRFALRETLAGFLPYVWGHMFGGIWQEVELLAGGQAVFTDVAARGTPDGQVAIEAHTSTPTAIMCAIYDTAGALVASAEGAGPELRLQIAAPRAWSPDEPALYTARLTIADGDARELRFGLRALRAEGSTILLNDRPIYPRLALSWGWYPETLHSNPGRERVRADFARLKQLGYNGVKLCLWFPPQYYFELADELGMLLWVELPMWIPQPSAFFRSQVPREYERLIWLARSHPAVILYTLGCELSRVVDAQMLAPLYALVKRLAGDALVRDNSGSGEAYGGLLNEYAEFYDYHFYSELQHFRGLLDYFAPRGRPPMPWLFGEYCDYDTFREPRTLNQEPEEYIQNAEYKLPDTCATEQTVLGSWFSSSSRPWWASEDPAVNPQGARWQMDLPYHERRLHANGMWARGAELARISEQQGFWHRKYTIEQTRLFREVSGYVITGEADTPISTAGMWDAHDRLKFDPAAFQGFNADLVLLLGWDRRREWRAGGDRAAPWDSWSYPAGASVRPHLIASHYGAARGPATLRWQVTLGGELLAQGQQTTSFALAPGELRELAVAEFTAPPASAPRQATLSAELSVGGERAQNSWPLWFFPRDHWRASRDVALFDPLGQLGDLAQLAPNLQTAKSAEGAKAKDWHAFVPFGVFQHSVVITTFWTPELSAWVEQGGRAIVVQAGELPDGPLPAVALPFWREAIRLAEPHPAWRDFPRDDALALQLFGCATDHALDLGGYAGDWRPILRRLDSRTMHLHEYAAELSWGAGRLIVSTLRFMGGQGAQPLGLARNTAASYLLWCWVEWLRSS